MPYPLRESTVDEVQTLRQELADTRKKLQDYADTIVSLHCELRTLRDGICSMCKQKFVPGSLQTPESAVDSSFVDRILSSQGPAEHTNSTYSWGSLLKAVSDLIPIRSDPPTSEIRITPNSQTLLPILSTPTPIPSPSPVLNTVEPASISNALSIVASTSGATTTQNTPWFAKREATARPALDATFVYAFNHKDSVQSVRFSADGKYLAAALKDSKYFIDGTILIYDVETCEKACVLAEYESQYSSKRERPGVNCLCFSPAGRFLVSGDMAGRVTVWDIQTKRMRSIFRGHNRSVEAVDVSPDGRLVVSASWDSVVRIWNMRDGSAKVFTDQNLSSKFVRFSLSGHYVVVPGYFNKIDPMLRIWDVRTGRLRLIRHENGTQRSAFTLDGNGMGLVGGDLQGPMKQWDDSLLQYDGGGLVPALSSVAYIGHTGTVFSVAISPDGQWVVSASYDKTAIFWDTRTAVPQYTLIGHRSTVSSADFSPAGTYFATGGTDGHVTLWRYKS